ncbi:MAG: TIGR03747 family integrating conjugative element membrane protein [Pseudomonadota bacterium]
MILTNRETTGAPSRAVRKGPSTNSAKQANQPSRLLGVFVMLLSALVISIIIEWLGIALWWSDQGLQHSVTMVAVEAGYLNSDFTEGVFNSSPMLAIMRFAGACYYGLFEWTGLENGLRWLGDTLGVYEYAMAVPAITHLFFIRLGVLFFSLPVYGLAAVAGITSGLTFRDIRRWSAGREFGRVYHFAKTIAPRMLIVAWFLYLAVPVAIHPNLIILPFAVLFGINVTIMSAAYKKYL